MHEKVSCTQCHVKPVFTDVGKNCADCHADIHRRKFGSDCAQCHTVKGWRVNLASIKEHQNRFPLVGAHAAVECEACHKGAAVGQYQGLSTDCASCHLKDFQKTTNPSHTALSFPTACQACHMADSWLGAKFDHLKFTGYALTGAHATLDCVACHVGGKYQGTPTDCYTCHTKDYNGTRNPPHASAGIPTTCAACHTTSAWVPATFDHNKTAFPLTGAHVSVPCTSCHINNNFTSTPTDCYACHVKNYNGTNNPPHASSGIPTTCAVCHNTTAWQPATFDHNKTLFPLTGAHVTVPCSSCHINGNYTSTPSDCYGCHKPDYDGAKNPNHVAASFPTTCQTCHSTTNWSGASFNHATTGFPLTGAHVSVPCQSCHVNNNYALKDPSCKACHLPDYNTAKNPDHVAAGFPTDCTLCHNTINWTSATFNHASTGFALTGAHTTLLCATCHVNNNYALNDPTCKACHLPDYNKTTNPNHAQVGFPQTCEVCHTTTAWQPATFDHNKTIFPLTGAHVSVPCTSCHINGNYTTTPTDCYGCHAANYNATTNPNHKAAGFPTTCATCHNTTSWAGAVFNHTWFRIPHHNAQCSDCHINSANYVVFSCIANCHPKAQTDGHHGGVNGYSYGPTTCYNCHKN